MSNDKYSIKKLDKNTQYKIFDKKFPLKSSQNKVPRTKCFLKVSEQIKNTK